MADEGITGSLLSKDGHESCILEKCGVKGIAWKGQSPGIRLRPKQIRSGTEEVGMESRDTLEYFLKAEKTGLLLDLK